MNETRSRRTMVVFSAAVVAVHIATFAFQWFHWPFSNYPMFSTVAHSGESGVLVFFTEINGVKRKLLLHRSRVALVMYQIDITPHLWSRLKSAFSDGDAEAQFDAKERLFLLRGNTLAESLSDLKVPRTAGALIIEYWILKKGERELIPKSIDSIKLNLVDLKLVHQ